MRTEQNIAILLHKLSHVIITQLYIENKTSPKKTRVSKCNLLSSYQDLFVPSNYESFVLKSSYSVAVKRIYIKLINTNNHLVVAPLETNWSKS